MHTCKAFLVMCLWQGEVVNCTDFFSIRRTDNGYCCSFNTLPMSEQFASASEISGGVAGETSDEDDHDDYGDDYSDDYGEDYDDYDPFGEDEDDENGGDQNGDQ